MAFSSSSLRRDFHEALLSLALRFSCASSRFLPKESASKGPRQGSPKQPVDHVEECGVVVDFLSAEHASL